MSDSILELMDGEGLTNQKKAINQVFDEVEQRHIEYFKSQPSMFDDEYLRIRECFFLQIFPPSDTKSERHLYFRIDAIREIPDHIANDLNNSMAAALAPYWEGM